MKTHSLFPSLVSLASLPVKIAKTLNQDILDECYKIRDSDDVGQNWSSKNYPGGYTSYSSINELYKFSSTFEDLKKQIDIQVQVANSNLRTII